MTSGLDTPFDDHVAWHRHGCSDQDIAAVRGGNPLRVRTAVWPR